MCRKLIELNTHLDYSVFPRFLDHSQIDYLLDISYKKIEAYQLKIILKALKKKQIKLKDEQNNEYFNHARKKTLKSVDKILSTFTSTFFGDDKISKNSSEFYRRSFSNKILEVFEGIFKNSEKMSKLAYNQRIEDMHVNY